jgi:hypothetical protein
MKNQRSFVANRRDSVATVNVDLPRRMWRRRPGKSALSAPSGTICEASPRNTQGFSYETSVLPEERQDILETAHASVIDALLRGPRRAQEA